MLAFRSLDPFRALREPDRRRRDEERLSRSEQRTLSKTQNNHLTGKAPYKFESALLQEGVRCEPDLLDHGYIPDVLGGIERQRRGNGSSPHWNVKAGPALSGPFALGEKLGVADLGRLDDEILGGLVIILRQQSKRHFQIVLPRQIGQLPEMVCSVTTVGDVDHPRETARPVNRSHSAACAAGSDSD